MKKLIAITILASFLGSTTELHELFKIPHLLVHFIEHLNEGSDVTPGEYLHIHYAHDHENHQDEHHDKGCLPFQGGHSCSSFSFCASVDHPSDFQLTVPSSATQSNLNYNESALSNYHASIWQPPKIG